MEDTPETHFVKRLHFTYLFPVLFRSHIWNLLAFTPVSNLKVENVPPAFRLIAHSSSVAELLCWPYDCAHSAGKYKLFSSDTIPSPASSWPVLVFGPAVQARAWRALLLPLCPMLSLSTLCHILSGTLLCTLHSFGPGWGTSICQTVIVYQELIWGPFVLSFRVSFPRSQSPVHLLPGTETHCSALAEDGSSASLFFRLKTDRFYVSFLCSEQYSDVCNPTA